MRVIKFRAWKDGEMSNPFYFGQVASFPSGIVTSYFGDEIMQFTGLTDSNGVEIYEGDIIGGGELVAGYVAFKDGAFRLNQGHDNTTDSSLVQWRTGKLKVIGNIHQNPDLLESDDV